MSETIAVPAGPVSDMPPLATKTISAWETWCRLRLRTVPNRTDWTLVALRHAGAGQRVVLRLAEDGKPPLIFKCHPGLKRHIFIDGVKAHRRFERALADHPIARVPRLVTVLQRKRILVMEAAPGREALRLAQSLKGDIDGQLSILTKCTQWSSATWRILPKRCGNWDGTATMARLLKALNATPETLSGPIFESLGQQAKQGIMELIGQPVSLVQSHGDLHLSNLIIAPDGVTYGIDFEDRFERPVEHDLARLLTHFMTMLGPQHVDGMRVLLVRAHEALIDAFRPEMQLDVSLLRAHMMLDTLVYWVDCANPASLTTRMGRSRFKRTAAFAEAITLDSRLD